MNDSVTISILGQNGGEAKDEAPGETPAILTPIEDRLDGTRLAPSVLETSFEEDE